MAREGVCPLIGNLGTKWRWEVSFPPQALHRGYSCLFRLSRRLFGLPSGLSRVSFLQGSISGSCILKRCPSLLSLPVLIILYLVIIEHIKLIILPFVWMLG